MGRRTLRKIHPELDLSRYLYQLDDLTPPFVAEQAFGSTAPLEVEMGSGKGLFMATASADQPERHFLGVEVSKRYARYAAARLAKKERANAMMIAGDGLKFFREFLATESVDAVHVYFPDPWWKKRHRRRRVLNEPFLEDVQRVLKPQGRLHFWTDVQEYFETTLELIARVTSLEGPHAVDESTAEHDLDYRTHFERRTRLAELPVYRAEYGKAAGHRETEDAH